MLALRALHGKRTLAMEGLPKKSPRELPTANRVSPTREGGRLKSLETRDTMPTTCVTGQTHVLTTVV